MRGMNLYVVTGTTKGLGRALADAIAADAANFLVTLARAPEASTERAVAICVDLAHTSALQAACDRMESALAGRRFDKAVLVNNAGIVSPVGPLEVVEPSELEANIAVNLTAPMLLMQRFLQATRTVALRRIINISSGAGRRPIFGWSGYCAAKAGLDMASRVVALEAAQRGERVEVVSLAPGVIDTAMQGVVRSAPVEAFADVERFRQMKAEGQLRPAAEVAADILRLEAAGKLAGEPVQDLRSLAG
jgi:benzil reductase ((S)-benzoin forming)